ncbi:hypothetical protein ASPZODRAFT_12948 [Penicilliopsis zonata CBS 506.65]|uniref:Uncharacterized protein n=1 Tax=Penicilliopsis zonata CBS 506.65 TaxID=1073090 RepID=A0A1L9SRT9_9EURO|nr:hypothetical protein ASPZODRAFT_12948 [Penicilliopsis zonata CBS 506.65]OJJ49836.1 hypothetical protein ASPZODRAFT_12948 [Penicilliopsis zonata CBS 506.65]
MAGFLDLPLKIRKKIYRYSLVVPRVFVRPFMSMEYTLDPDRQGKHPIPNFSLLLASKMIYNEAMPIFLGENTFSLVHVDLLATLAHQHERVASNLTKIRKLELVFDVRDYNFLAQFLADESLAVAAEVEELTEDDDGSVRKHKTDAINELIQLHEQLSIEDTAQETKEEEEKEEEKEYDDKAASLSSAAVAVVDCAGKNGQIEHDHQIENIRELLWGRTLTFVRQKFELSYLFIDLRRCTCADGCCRLVEQVLDWGWVHVWLHGMPKQIQVRGITEQEKQVIAGILERQLFQDDLTVEEIYDQERATDHRMYLRYNELLRDVYQKLDRENRSAQKKSMGLGIHLENIETRVN